MYKNSRNLLFLGLLRPCSKYSAVLNGLVLHASAIQTHCQDIYTCMNRFRLATTLRNIHIILVTGQKDSLWGAQFILSVTVLRVACRFLGSITKTLKITCPLNVLSSSHLRWEGSKLLPQVNISPFLKGFHAIKWRWAIHIFQEINPLPEWGEFRRVQSERRMLFLHFTVTYK